MGTAVIVFHWMLLFFTSKLSEAVFNRKPDFYSLLNKEELTVEDKTPTLQRNKREAGNTSLQEYVIDIKITLPSSEMLMIKNLINYIPFPVPVNTQLYSFTITSATITTVCDKVCNCARGYMWSPGICSAYQSCSNTTVGENCGCVTQVPSNSTCEPETINSTTMATSISTVGTSSSTMTKTELTSVMQSTKSTTETSPARQTTLSMITPSETLTMPADPLMTSVSTALSTNLTTPTIKPAFTVATTSVTIVTSTSMIAPTSTSSAKLSSQTEMPTGTSVTETMSSVNTMLTTTSESKLTTMPTLMSTTETLLPTITLTPLTSVVTSKTSTAVTAPAEISVKTTKPTLMSTTVTSLSSMTITPLTSWMMSMTLRNVTSPITQASVITTLNITTSEAQPTTQVVIIPMSFSINESFTDTLNDETSAQHKNYVSDINNALITSYRGFPGFQSAKVNRFSNGSVKVAYEVAGSGSNPTPEEITTANNNLVKALPDYKIIPSSFIAVVGSASLVTQRQTVSDGDTILLSCNSSTKPPSDYIIKWYLGDQDLQRNTPTLSVKATEKWSGIYACKYTYGNGTVETNPGSTNISVIPIPNAVITYNATFVKGNDGGTTQNITCCVDKGNATFYNVTLNTTTGIYPGQNDQSNPLCYIFKYTLGNWKDESAYCIVTNTLGKEKSSPLKISYINDIKTVCNTTQFGLGENGNSSTKPCTGNQFGTISATCVNGSWSNVLENCTSVQLLKLLETVQNFNNSPIPITENLPKVLNELANLSQSKSTNITSVGNLVVMVKILEEISLTSVQNVEKDAMTDFLTSASSILENTSIANWLQLNGTNVSSRLLSSVENFTKRFVPGNKTDEIRTDNIELQSTEIFPNETSLTYNKSFFNNLGSVKIPASEFTHPAEKLLLVISIGFKTLGSILPLNIVNDTNNTSNFAVNGILMSTNVNTTIKNITHKFKKTNNQTLNTPKCVFWDFTQSEWNDSGCEPEMGNYAGDIIICTCNHLTSFSILMSYNNTDIPQFLDWVTYIGLGISIGSLVICLLLEGLVWKSITKNKTSYMRHVSVVNIAMSLLIADIWFIIGIAIKEGGKMAAKYDAACKATTFFIHFFYLSLFFWMFTLGLLLFYRLVLVFHDMSRTTMMIIAFSLGYGGPLIISIITIAVTAPDKYIRTNACWLNWDNSKALLAFVIPALTIVGTNVIFLLVVIIKIMRPTVGERPRMQEKNTMVQIARSVTILTPLLGLTWGFGIATVVVGDSTFHIIFTILNAFQGFFILVFGTLLDRKVRDTLLQRLLSSRWASQQTKNTYSGSSPGPLSRAIDNMFNRKGNTKSNATNSSSNISSRQYSVFS